MKKIYFAILSLSIICYSCKKSDENTSTTTPTNNTTTQILLRKIVTTNVSPLTKDSIQYFYDNNNRVIRIMANSSSYSDTQNITRNSSGIITSFNNRNTFGSSSSTISIDPTSSRYISAIRISNTGQRDTNNYIYTADKITKILNNKYSATRTITYDNNGNLIKDSSLTIIFKRTYDTNVPSLTFGNEILVFGYDEAGQSGAEENTGTNNVLSASVIQNGIPGYNFTYVYTYNSENRPASVIEKNGTVTKSTSIFYYQ
jgi:hypothetical protein